MKKGWKIFGIVCAVIAGVGILLCIAGFAIGISRQEVRDALKRGGIGLHSYKTQTKAEVKRIDGEKNGMTYEGIREFDVEAGRMEVYVTMTDEDAVRVEDQTHERVDLQCYQDGDTLKIEGGSGHRGTNHDGEHGYREINHEGIIRIYIPRSIALEKAKFSIGAGVLKVDGLTADEIDIECGAGEVQFTAGGQEKDYNFGVGVGVGEVTIGSETMGGLAVEKQIDNHAHREISVECGAGKVNIAFEE